jgi:hypothetical protein
MILWREVSNDLTNKGFKPAESRREVGCVNYVCCRKQKSPGKTAGLSRISAECRFGLKEICRLVESLNKSDRARFVVSPTDDRILLA